MPTEVLTVLVVCCTLGLLLCIAALAGGWLNRELTRRAGVILGTDFFVVRAHARTTPHLVQGDSVDQGARLATFDDPEGDREEQHLRGDIAVLEQEIADTRLKPLVLDPELLRLSQDVNDSQRGRLSQLGYGVLHAAQAGSFSTQAFKDDGLVTAQRAQSTAAELQYERTASLVQAGIVARNKLDAAAAAAQTAAQKLRERENLIQETKAGSDAIAQAKSAIARDNERAKAERTAELAELEARRSEFRTSLRQLHLERSVMAPFGGTVVYRHPSPALAEDDQVILALAKGCRLPGNGAGSGTGSGHAGARPGAEDEAQPLAGKRGDYSAGCSQSILFPDTRTAVTY